MFWGRLVDWDHTLTVTPIMKAQVPKHIPIYLHRVGLKLHGLWSRGLSFAISASASETAAQVRLANGTLTVLTANVG